MIGGQRATAWRPGISGRPEQAGGRAQVAQPGSDKQRGQAEALGGLAAVVAGLALGGTGVLGFDRGAGLIVGAGVGFIILGAVDYFRRQPPGADPRRR